MKNILVIKLRYLGDIVLCTPLLPLLRKQFSRAHITFLVNAGTEEVLQGNPDVDDIWTLPRHSRVQQFKFLWQLRQAKFDLVIDLTDGDRSAFLSWATGASVRLGYNRDRRWRGKCYSQTLPSAYGSMHMVDYHAQALRALGMTEAVSNPELRLEQFQDSNGDPLPDSWKLKDQPLVLLYPAARYTFKAWPIERFAALADWLAEKKCQVVLIGAAEERSLGQQIINLCKQKPENLIGRTSIATLARLIKESELLVGNDGGPLHVASALGCPVLGLFGPTDPAVWGPRGKKTTVIYKGLDCRECFYPGCDRGEESCMRQISVDEVCQAALSLLSHTIDEGNTFVSSEE